MFTKAALKKVLIITGAVFLVLQIVNFSVLFATYGLVGDASFDTTASVAQLSTFELIMGIVTPLIFLSLLVMITASAYLVYLHIKKRSIKPSR